LYPGVREILEQLAEDYPLFIVSNCQAGYIEAFLDAYHLSALFIDFRSSEVSGRTKAENIRDLVQRYALRSPVYIGDTQLDAEAAALAEVPFIYASYGFETVTGADYTITGFADLLSVLEQ
jgi:phosphoglycolate phosphatase